MHRALLAAAAVEAAGGVFAALVANAWGSAHDGSTVFATCTAGAAISDMVLVPGWAWAPHPSVPGRLARRTVLAVLTVAAAILAGLLLLALGSLVHDIPLDGAAVFLAFGVPFLAGGAVAGLGAAIAGIWDNSPGLVRARWRSHVAGGIAGVLLVLALAAAARWTGSGSGPQPRVWWALFAWAPLTLVLGGGIRNLLMARDAVRTGTALAAPGAMAGRVMASCALCLALAAATVLMPT